MVREIAFGPSHHGGSVVLDLHVTSYDPYVQNVTNKIYA